MNQNKELLRKNHRAASAYFYQKGFINAFMQAVVPSGQEESSVHTLKCTQLRSSLPRSS